MERGISVGILAGGMSRRMGRDKALLVKNGETFLERIAGELSGFSEVLISAAEAGKYESFGYRVVYDRYRDIGPLAGVARVLEEAREQYVFICGADMPNLKKEVVEYLAAFICSDYDCYCLTDGVYVHPLCGIYSKRVLPVLYSGLAEGKQSIRELLLAVRTKYVSIDLGCFERSVVENVNTPKQYRKVVLPAVFCVSGVKNSGKTTLIERLIPAFEAEGFRAAVIKHDGHEYEMDKPGTDTYRFREAGAEYAVIYSGSQYAVLHRGAGSVEDLIGFCRGADMIMIEGLKYSDYPKVEVVRSAVSQSGVCNPSSLICMVTDSVSDVDQVYPIYGMDETEAVTKCIKAYFGLE